MAALAGAWEWAARASVLDFQFLPPPSGVGRGLWEVARSGALVPAALHTLRSTLVGWLAAAVIGTALGLLLGRSDRAWRWSMASIELVRAVPPVALAPVALLGFGFSLQMELTLIVYAGLWTVMVSAADGVRRVPAELLDVARVLRLSRPATLAKVVLPAAGPSILVGLRLALSLSLVLAVVAEMIGNPMGLGNALVRAQQALQPEQMFAYLAAIGLLGVGLNTALLRAGGWVERRP
ncbi:MAG: ABC transporter permease [Acidimicrobiales bacterium]